MRINVKYKKTDPRALEPRHGTKGSAGYDIGIVLDEPPEGYSWNEYYEVLAPMEMRLFRSGLAVELPPDHYATLHTRSSTLQKGLLIPATVVDCDFRGEIKIPVINVSSHLVKIWNGERLAQLVVGEYRTIVLEEAEQLHETERNEGGFGSTDGKEITI